MKRDSPEAKRDLRSKKRLKTNKKMELARRASKQALAPLCMSPFPVSKHRLSRNQKLVSSSMNKFGQTLRATYTTKSNKGREEKSKDEGEIDREDRETEKRDFYPDLPFCFYLPTTRTTLAFRSKFGRISPSFTYYTNLDVRGNSFPFPVLPPCPSSSSSSFPRFIWPLLSSLFTCSVSQSRF